MKMKNNKLVGYLLIGIAIISSLVILAKLPIALNSFYEVLHLSSNNLDSYNQGLVIGNSIYWFLHYVITFLLWKFGLRILTNVKKENETEDLIDNS